MDPQKLWQMRQRRPFEPFKMILDDGRSFDVDGPQRFFVTTHFVRVVTSTTPEGLNNDAVEFHPDRVDHVELLKSDGVGENR